ncbi:hypothetical protein [Sphaerobacter thermophilus]|uniref:Uncharacterized protein n=1 Tax=Sphaerobacter thermophilus (strain ATCC 49802 / DSM 20745 / KCCM 41009 / NCIMB 13125 / S 6022) TaxID=479434 RepID=D1CAT8_SPHTD|nr:hypothetical protein [Sphaerobacter thermophilus]ACZ39885.1 hypothetical protein Sthe_2470 [Sphaerobacter thermophilus DSM 20745]
MLAKIGVTILILATAFALLLLLGPAIGAIGSMELEIGLLLVVIALVVAFTLIDRRSRRP